MDNNFHKDDKKTTNKSRDFKIITYVLSALVLISVVFTSTYFITNMILNVSSNKNDELNNLEDKAVYNSTKALSNNYKILLMNEEVVVQELNIDDFKNENDLAIDVSESYVVNYYKENGYEVDSIDDEKIVFKKKNEDIVLKPNKYYVGEKDGYFAIFKSNDKGVLSLEKKDECPISILNNHPQDLEEIKTFKYSFDTFEEAAMQISQYTS